MESCKHCGSHDMVWVQDDVAGLFHCRGCGTRGALVWIDEIQQRATRRTCKVCSKGIEGKRKDAKYCSPKCRQKASRARKRKTEYICQKCGDAFAAARSAKFCSPKCRQAEHRFRKWQKNAIPVRIEKHG